MKPKKLLSDLIENVDTQSRVSLSQETIAEYVEVAKKLPPADVFFDGDKYYLADGWHRFYAWDAAGIASIPCLIHDGGLRDALLFAASANQSHGLKRSNSDKRRAVGILLADEEWAAWSDNRIAEHCGVSQNFVSSLRAQLTSDVNSTAADSEKPREKSPTRVGRDGKRYPAPAPKKAASEPEPAAAEEPEETGPNIARLAEPYVRACNDLVRMKKDLKAIAKQPEGAHLATKIVRLEKDIDDLRVNIAQTEPLSLCGKCGGEGCQHCARTGFWTRMTVNSLKRD